MQRPSRICMRRRGGNVPLILLAIPSAIIGWFTVGPVLFGDYFGDAIFVSRAGCRCSLG